MQPGFINPHTDNPRIIPPNTVSPIRQYPQPFSAVPQTGPPMFGQPAYPLSGISPFMANNIMPPRPFLGQGPSMGQHAPQFGAPMFQKKEEFESESEDAEIDETKVEAEFATKLAREMKRNVESDAKVQLLCERVTKLEEQKELLREQAEKYRKSNHKLTEKVMEFEREKAITEFHQIQNVNTGTKEAVIQARIQMERNKARQKEKLRKERAEIRKQMLMGVEYLDEGGELGIYSQGEESRLKIIYQKLLTCFDFFVPMRAAIKYIKARYDSSVSGFFVFYRYLMGFSITTVVLFLYLLTSHFITSADELADTCNSLFPCFVFYSAFSDDQKYVYSWTLYIFLLLALIFAIFRFLKFYKENKQSQIKTGDSHKFARLLFNCWDWDTCNHSDCSNARMGINNAFKALMNEEEIRKNVANRTCKALTLLYLLRFFLLLLNLIFLAIGWMIIVLIYLYERDIVDAFDGIPIFGVIADYIPGMVVVCVNFVIPAITIKITALERWDFTSTRTKNEIWKLLIAKFSNLIIFAAVHIEFLFREEYFTSGGVIKHNTDYDCLEDQVAAGFIRLIAVDYLFGLISPIFGIASRFFNNKPSPEFKTAYKVVSLLYLQSLIWGGIIFSPYLVILLPIFLYIKFYHVKYLLTSHSRRPKLTSTVTDSESFIMMFYIFTLIVYCVFFSVLVSNDMDHTSPNKTDDTSFNCGPFPTQTSIETPFYDSIESIPLVGSIFDMMRFTPVLWLVILLLGTATFMQNNHLTVLESYIKDKESQYLLQTEQLQKAVSKYKLRLEKYKQTDSQMMEEAERGSVM